MIIKRNDIYKDTFSMPEVCIRILLTIPEDDIAVVISLTKKDSLPYFDTLSNLEANIVENTLECVEDDVKPIDLNKLLDSQRTSLEKDWNMIGEFVSDIPNCFNKCTRSVFISECCTKYGITRKQVQRILYRYWSGGMTIEALVHDYRKRGAQGQKKETSMRRSGRPVMMVTKNARIQIGEKERKQIETVINRTYNKNCKFSIKNAYDIYLRQYYTICNTSTLVDAYPTYAQFNYHANKYIDAAKHFGKRKYNLVMRGVTGSSRQQTGGPGEQYQIDATIADCYLVASYDCSKNIGRPVLYLVTDVFSRMITGFYVGLNGPSWENAMMALCYAFMDKVDLCKIFDIEISKEKWPCVGIPYRILTDNGELVGKNSNNLASKLLITMQNAPAWRADMKGVVEQYFHQINLSSKAFLPGAVQADQGARGSHDNRKDAILTIKDFSRIVIRYILKANSRQLTSHPQIADDIIKDKVPQIPIELWKWGQQNRTGLLMVKDSETIMMDLLPSDTALVTSKGIRFKKIHFICETATEMNWFSRARTKGVWKCDIKYDPRNFNHIILVHDNGEYEWCNRTQADAESYPGWYVENVDIHQNDNKSIVAAGKESNIQNDLSYEDEVGKIVESAYEQRNVQDINAALNKPDIKNMKQSRKKEAELIRKEEALEPKPNVTISESENDCETNSINYGYSGLIARLQREKNNDR